MNEVYALPGSQDFEVDWEELIGVLHTVAYPFASRRASLPWGSRTVAYVGLAKRTTNRGKHRPWSESLATLRKNEGRKEDEKSAEAEGLICC